MATTGPHSSRIPSLTTVIALALATLAATGKAKVKAEVTYTPTGGDPTIVANTDTKALKLITRR